MRYPEAYARIYQKMQGYKIKIKAPNDEYYIGYLSLEPSTRSTYDIAMRDATIEGIVTMDNIEKLKPSQIFYREDNINELFIIQSVNQFEHQSNTRNINAIKQNSSVTIERLQYDEETYEDKYKPIYTDLVSFVSMKNYDEKNFQAGIEDNTQISIQIPKMDINGNIYELNNGDRIILKNIQGGRNRNIKVESIDEFGVPGVTRIYGTFETRTGD